MTLWELYQPHSCDTTLHDYILWKFYPTHSILQNAPFVDDAVGTLSTSQLRHDFILFRLVMQIGKAAMDFLSTSGLNGSSPLSKSIYSLVSTFVLSSLLLSDLFASNGCDIYNEMCSSLLSIVLCFLFILALFVHVSYFLLKTTQSNILLVYQPIIIA